ncbi:hypothetical protein COLO4_25412 [Corchorus olitorius]|uniref:FAF domain-containing protein n=1 Tax=Corchorus olitorius TaxID=93759 RepID=A0A1R3I344_9ROSI|nr:hypothetical protein COLO4_25412 [Corchorus olitorius]
MSAPLSKSLGLSSALKISEEVMVTTKKQGIVSILGMDSDHNSRPSNTKSASSLRRTLSADMSSKKWLTQHGFSPLKKIASSDEFPVSILDSSSEEEEEETEEARGQFDIWASIQQEKKQKELDQKPGQFDIWSSIISQQKAEDESSKSLPPPYIHPLVKRSASSLSEKSLEICTESLGSETGSDGFSSYPPSETGDIEEEHKEEDQQLQQTQPQKPESLITSFDAEEPRIVKYDVSKKLSSNRSFPPPIPSLSSRDGASLRMKTHRDNGRLVLEAVSVPSQNNFLAQRQDGRLVLTFANTTPSDEAESNEIDEAIYEVEEEVKGVEELEESFGEELENESEEEEEEEEMDEEEEEEEYRMSPVNVMEQQEGPKLPTGALNVHRLAVMMKKPMGWNPTWPKTFDEIVKLGEEIKEDKVVVDQPSSTTPHHPPPPPPLAQSLPMRPRVARLIPSSPSTAAAAAGAASSFNAYEYYWRPNQPMSKATILNPIAQKDNSSNKQQPLSNDQQQQQQLLVFRGNKVDYFVPLLKGCKEARRPSLLFWEPYCIATS